MLDIPDPICELCNIDELGAWKCLLAMDGWVQQG